MTMTRHRTGGSKGANGYGEYQVRYASEKQINFIKKLLQSKEHAYNLTDEQVSKLNVQGAGEIITNLLNQPNKAGVVIHATEKQISFAQALILKKEGSLITLNALLQKNNVFTLEELNKADVSTLINELRQKADKKIPIQITDVGAYLLGETIYSIRKGNESKKWQVWSYSDEQKKYVHDEPRKEREVLATVTDFNRLTLEQAIKYSAQTGICCHCGRTLTQLKSVAGGIGPICAKRYK
jgi:Family of unknown function (DUF6011)